MRKEFIENFLSRHQLPKNYLLTIEKWFSPLAAKIANKHQLSNKTLVIGINGAQGSGKTTLADLLVQLFENEFALKTVALSLDDFYYTHQERKHLSQTIHPLLQTRGVPGTHDIALAIKTLQQLTSFEDVCIIPRSNKISDDRYPETHWDKVDSAVDIIIVEGWCFGADAQQNEALLDPVNDLEALEDGDASWRRYVNEQLKELYPKLFSFIDVWLMLKAPSFDCVYQWRLEQELKQRRDHVQEETVDEKLMSEHDIKRFIKFYQRITEHVLRSLPSKVDYVLN